VNSWVLLEELLFCDEGFVCAMCGHCSCVG